NLTFGLLRDDGAVVYLNSNEVFRSNMPDGTILNGTLASSAISGTEETTWFTNKTANTSWLHQWTNVVAVEVHQGSTNIWDSICCWLHKRGRRRSRRFRLALRRRAILLICRGRVGAVGICIQRRCWGRRRFGRAWVGRCRQSMGRLCTEWG